MNILEDQSNRLAFKEAKSMQRLENQFRNEMLQQKRKADLEAKVKEKEQKKAKLLEEIKRDQQNVIQNKRFKNSMDSVNKAGVRDAMTNMKYNSRATDPGKDLMINENKRLMMEHRRTQVSQKQLMEDQKRMK